MGDPVTNGISFAQTAISMGSQIAEGKAQEKASKYRANSQLAKGTRDAEEARREGRILESNARAAMVANGGTTTDAGAIDTLSSIRQEADYNSLASIFEGERAADITRYEGKLAKQASKNKAISTALSGGASLYKSYKADEKKKPKKKTTKNNTYSSQYQRSGRI